MRNIKTVSKLKAIFPNLKDYQIEEVYAAVETFKIAFFTEDLLSGVRTKPKSAAKPETPPEKPHTPIDTRTDVNPFPIDDIEQKPDNAETQRMILEELRHIKATLQHIPEIIAAAHFLQRQEYEACMLRGDNYGKTINLAPPEQR